MSDLPPKFQPKPPPPVNWAAVGLSIFFALVMFKCSAWQWDRYKEKIRLLATFKENTVATAIDIPDKAVRTDPKPVEESYNTVQGLLYKMVRTNGRFDYSKQLIITNRKNKDGPGHLLFAPFQVEGSNHWIMVSRGFIPYIERDPDSWKKYGEGLSEPQTIYGIMQEAKLPKSIGPTNPEKTSGDFERIYFFEEITRMADELSLPLARDFFIQQVGGPTQGRYPEEAISIQIPPSTHFGYTIEWALLGTLTLIIGLGRQFYNYRRLREYRLTDPAAPTK